eukprot:scaffold179823_cov18-Tisochrysis_lutea.AAC.3
MGISLHMYRGGGSLPCSLPCLHDCNHQGGLKLSHASSLAPAQSWWSLPCCGRWRDAVADYLAANSIVCPLQHSAHAEQSFASMSGTKIFVSNLPYSMDWADLKRVFRQAGTGAHLWIAMRHAFHRTCIALLEFPLHAIVKFLYRNTNICIFPAVLFAGVMKDKEKGTSKGCGVVEFETPEQAQLAIAQFNGQQVGRRQSGGVMQRIRARVEGPSFQDRSNLCLDLDKFLRVHNNFKRLWG